MALKTPPVPLVQTGAVILNLRATLLPEASQVIAMKEGMKRRGVAGILIPFFFFRDKSFSVYR